MNMNPLFQFSNESTQHCIKKDECAITLIRPQKQPLTIWFRSRSEMVDAYNAWKRETKSVEIPCLDG